MTRPATTPDAPSWIWMGVVAAGDGTRPVATPASAAASALTKKSPTGTLEKVTVPAAFVKPVIVVAAGPGVASPNAAFALSVTSALGTTPAPLAGITVTVTLPTPRKRTIASAT